MPKNNKFEINKKYLLATVVIALALYVIVPQLGDFKASTRALEDQDYKWTFVAVGLTFTTYFAGGATYKFLSLKRIKYFKTVVMQFAAMFINRLVPAGLGAVGLNYLYLRANKHKNSQASVVVAINNLMGFLGHFTLFVLLIALLGDTDLPTRHSDGATSILPKFLGAALGVGVIVIVIFARTRFLKFIKEVKSQLNVYKHRPTKLLGALASSMTLTLCNVLALQCCLLAIGVHLSLIETLFVFSFGVGGGAALPTPGGLGGFEAGLTASMVGYGVNSSEALAVALLYRLISYWLTLITGAGAFVFAQRQDYFKATS